VEKISAASIFIHITYIRYTFRWNFFREIFERLNLQLNELKYILEVIKINKKFIYQVQTRPTAFLLEKLYEDRLEMIHNLV